MKIDRLKIHQKFNGHCSYCGCEIQVKDMQVDHLLPKYNFKTHILNNWKVPDWLNHLTETDVNHIDNLMPACRSCNKFKDTHHLELFRSEIEAQIKRQRDRPTFRLAERFGLIECTPKEVVFYFETLKK